MTGSVRLDGTELLGAPRRQLQAVRGSEISMIFQEPMSSLDPAFTIGQQIAEVIVRHRGGSRSAARERAAEVLGLVGMRRPRELLGHYPHEFSGGMRQRVMIAMALACEPRVLIADEPTTALDVTVQSQILGLLESMRESFGLAVVMITHDMGVVAEFCDDVVVMFQGQQIEGADVRSIFYGPRHPYTADLLAAMPTLDGMRASIARDPDTVRMDVGDGCRFGPRCPHARAECLGTPVPLEVIGEGLVRCRRAREVELQGVS